jgi:hypothetical protein
MRLRPLLTITFVSVFAVLMLASTSGGAPPAIRVSDATAEATSPSGASVTFHVKAYDPDTGNPIAATCTPPGTGGSGDFDVTGNFPLGSTEVTCTATLENSDPVSASLTVTVTDTTPPSLTSVSPVTAATTDSSGTTVTYTGPTATDLVDGPVPVTCNHPSGSTFPVGQTTVTCTASDSHGNTGSTSFTVTVTLNDTEAPTFTSVPAPITVNTSGTGAIVTYSVTASDNSGNPPVVSCNPPSGSTFPVGTTTVNCTASDGTNTATTSFTVTVVFVDTLPPTFTGVPASRTVEANSPSGSVVTYIKPTASDNVDGPIATVNCSPPSGSLFPLGGTTVDCSASDSHGNVGHATFGVFVDDTTPPAIYLPTSSSIVATSDAGISNSDPAAQRYFDAARAIDMIDPHPALTHEAPAQLVVGANTVIFHAHDASGNESQESATLTVLPPGSATPPPPTSPTLPANVTNVHVTPLDGAARITWSAGGRKVEVIRSTSSSRQLSALVDEKVVYTGTASRYVDRGLLNGVEYRYVVRAVDAAGNHSAGVAAVVTPRPDLLRSPKDGARLKKAPKLVWKADGEADYYNAQLMLNGAKVLSIWPSRASYALKKSWKFNGRKYTLKPGVYTWFVWPGYGARARVDYGPMLGSRTFRIVR